MEEKRSVKQEAERQVIANSVNKEKWNINPIMSKLNAEDFYDVITTSMLSDIKEVLVDGA